MKKIFSWVLLLAGLQTPLFARGENLCEKILNDFLSRNQLGKSADQLESSMKKSVAPARDESQRYLDMSVRDQKAVRGMEKQVADLTVQLNAQKFAPLAPIFAADRSEAWKKFPQLADEAEVLLNRYHQIDAELKQYRGDMNRKNSEASFYTSVDAENVDRAKIITLQMKRPKLSAAEKKDYEDLIARQKILRVQDSGVQSMRRQDLQNNKGQNQAQIEDIKQKIHSEFYESKDRSDEIIAPWLKVKLLYKDKALDAIYFPAPLHVSITAGCTQMQVDLIQTKDQDLTQSEVMTDFIFGKFLYGNSTLLERKKQYETNGKAYSKGSALETYQVWMNEVDKNPESTFRRLELKDRSAH